MNDDKKPMEQIGTLCEGLNDHTLWGYAAYAAASELLQSWRDAACDPDRDVELMVNDDLDDVIARLQQFKRKAIALLQGARQ